MAKEGTVENPETELKGADVVDNLEEHNAGVQYEPLFDTEKVTEAELMGEEVTEKKTVDSEPKDDPDPDKKAEEGKETDEEKAEREKKEAEDKNKAEAKPDAEKTDDEKKAEAAAKEEAEAKEKSETEAKEKDAKPSEDVGKDKEQIEGLTIGIRQERQTVSRLKQENQRLSAENETLKTPKITKSETEKWKDFKVLTDTEYSELLDEDADEAQKYLYKSGLFRDYQADVSKRQLSEHQSQAAERDIVNHGIYALEEILPGISQGKSELATKLTDFATEKGIDESVLQILTDPRTKVTTAEGENLIIGDGAAQLVNLIKSTFEAVSKVPDETKLREEIRKEVEAELRPKIEAEAQTNVIKKLKLDPTGDSFRSLDDVTGSSGKDVKPITGAISEAEYERMSEQEQATLLGME